MIDQLPNHLYALYRHNPILHDAVHAVRERGPTSYADMLEQLIVMLAEYAENELSSQHDHMCAQLNAQRQRIEELEAEMRGLDNE